MLTAIGSDFALTDEQTAELPVILVGAYDATAIATVLKFYFLSLQAKDIFSREITMPSYGQHLPVSNNYRQLYLLTVFIFMLRRGATVDTATSDDRLESVNITEPPSAIVQHNTTKPTPVGPQNITTLVAPGQTCGGYDGSNVVHKLQNLWDCQPRFRHGIYAGGAVFIVLIVPLVFLVTLRCRR